MNHVLVFGQKNDEDFRDLAQRRKTDAANVNMAARLRSETVMTLEWIAERLCMGCRHLANANETAHIRRLNALQLKRNPMVGRG